MTVNLLVDKNGDWQSTACAWAKEAWEHDFSKRTGVYCVQAEEGAAGYCVIYSNYPYADFPLLREQELAEIRCRLKAEGIVELAYASYAHIRGGYSDALVIAGGRARFVEHLVNRAVDVCWSRREN